VLLMASHRGEHPGVCQVPARRPGVQRSLVAGFPLKREICRTLFRAADGFSRKGVWDYSVPLTA
jgi:hypothetical protein